MTSNSKHLTKDLLSKAGEAALLPAGEAFTAVARAACELFGVQKVYFARALGNRFHYLGGFGEETYLPPEKAAVDGVDGLWFFCEGAEELTELEQEDLFRALREAGRQIWQKCKEEGEMK